MKTLPEWVEIKRNKVRCSSCGIQVSITNIDTFDDIKHNPNCQMMLEQKKGLKFYIFSFSTRVRCGYGVIVAESADRAQEKAIKALELSLTSYDNIEIVCYDNSFGYVEIIDDGTE